VLGAHLGQGRLHGAAHFHFAGALAAGHLEADHGLAVEQGHGARIGKGVGHRGQLVQAHLAAVGQGQCEARELLGRLHGGQGAHGLLAAAQVGAPARAFGLHQAQLARPVGRGGAQRLQL